jgi:hypothetical protein
MLLATLGHVIICSAMACGILFTTNARQSFLVLANLTIIFVGLRTFKGCMLTQNEEKESTTLIGKYFMLEDPDSVSSYNFEQIAVGLSIVLSAVRTFVFVFKIPIIF